MEIRRSLRGSTFVLCLIFALSNLAYADIICPPLQPNPADVYDLPHENFYIWQANLSIPQGQTIVSASLFIDNINNWKIEPDDILYISLLNADAIENAVSDLQMTKAPGSDIYRGIDGQSTGNALDGYGSPLTIYEDKNEYSYKSWKWNSRKGRWEQVTVWVNPPEDFTYNFSEDELALLNSYVKNDGLFGIGLDPDCHFYNDGFKFYYETASLIPEPASIFLLAFGSLVMLRKK